jgi:AbrB family looped-hinge helix DNA binding protein
MNRKIDNMGRIVIPMEIRKQLGIETNDDLKIEVVNGEIVISKLETNNKLDELLDLLYTCGETLDPKFQQRAIEIIKGKTQNK